MNTRKKNTSLILFALGSAFGGLLVALLLATFVFNPTGGDATAAIHPAHAAPTVSASPTADVVDDDAGAQASSDVQDDSFNEPNPAAPVEVAQAEPVRPAGIGEDVTSDSADALGEPFLTVTDSATALGVENRLPVDRGVRFSHDIDRVWAWVQIKNRTEKSHIFMVWKKDGVEVWRAKLKVGKSRGWRTNSRRRMGKRDVGSWTIDIIDAQERHLHTLAFDVVEPGEDRMEGASL